MNVQDIDLTGGPFLRGTKILWIGQRLETVIWNEDKLGIYYGISITMLAGVLVSLIITKYRLVGFGNIFHALELY